MKKLVYLSVFVLIFAFTACNDDNNDDNKVVDKPEVIHLTKAEFLTKVANYENNPAEWVYLGKKPCIIDFYADWCGPCKTIAPVLDELAEEYVGKIYIYKVDVDVEIAIANAYKIQSIPTLFFCKPDNEREIIKGAIPKDLLKYQIDNYLLK